MNDLERLETLITEIAAVEQAGSAIGVLGELDVIPAGAHLALRTKQGGIEEIHHRMLTKNTELDDLLERLSESDLEGPWSRIVPKLQEEIRFQRSIPPKLIGMVSKHSAIANKDWITARERGDFSIFEPALVEMVNLQRAIADCFTDSFETPYDALLARYDRDLSTAMLDPLFMESAGFLAKLMNAVTSSRNQPRSDFLTGDFDHAEQLEVTRIFLEDIGLPMDRIWLTTTTHPFTNGVIPGEFCVLTARRSRLLPDCVTAGIHEGGHGGMSIFGAEPFAQMNSLITHSFSVHESSSRFWENHVGRSRGFSKHMLTRLKNRFPTQFHDVSPELFFMAQNVVKSGFIRVNADQLTYLGHILVRFRVESELIDGKIEVSEIPEIWNSMMMELLGIKPENPSDGCLQDIHWGLGYFGYFPTYQVGNWLAAMIEKWVVSELGLAGVETFTVEHARAVMDFLRENYYVDSSILSTLDAVERITGRREIDLSPWMEHQSRLVGEVYPI